MIALFPSAMPSPAWERFTERIPSILFHLTLRFTLLRTICLATLVLNLQNLVWVVVEKRRPDALTNVTYAITFFHHFAT